MNTYFDTTTGQEYFGNPPGTFEMTKRKDGVWEYQPPTPRAVDDADRILGISYEFVIIDEIAEPPKNWATRWQPKRITT